MNHINRAGLMTVSITLLLFFGIATVYYGLDKRIDFAQKYASAFTAVRGPTPIPLAHAHLPEVAGISTKTALTASPSPQPSLPPTKDFYTNLYRAEQAEGLSEADLFSKDRVQAFITTHSLAPGAENLKLSLPITTKDQTEIIKVYTALTPIRGDDIMAVLTVPAENQAAAVQPLQKKVEDALITFQQTGTVPVLAGQLERHAGVLAAVRQNLTLLSRGSDDVIGSLIGADQLTKLAPLLDASTQEIITVLSQGVSGSPCGLCLSPDDLLQNAVTNPNPAVP